MTTPAPRKPRKRLFRSTHGTYDLVSNIIVFLFALIMLFPMYWMFSTALMEDAKITVQPPEWFPNPVSFDNFSELFRRQPVGLWVYNSFVIAFFTTVLVIIVSSIAAYSFSKLHFTGKNLVYVILISTLMIPKEVYLIPLFQTMQKMNLAFTTLGIILPNVAAPFGVFLLKQFFDSLPTDMREAARIDGCNELGIFYKIYMPMAKPGVGALFILMFVRAWNDYLWQLVMINHDDKQTLQLGVAAIQSEVVPNLTYKITGACMAAIPMIVVFLLFQRYFTRGITIGGVKE